MRSRAVIVDAVSFAGGNLTAVRKGFGVDVGFSASQKCIAAPPASRPSRRPVAVGVHGFADVEGWYLNLYTWARYETEVGRMASYADDNFSNLFYAFHRACRC